MVKDFQYEEMGIREGANSVLATETSEPDSACRADASLNAQNCDCPMAPSGEDSSWEACVEDPKVFFNALKVGRLRGVACVLGVGDVLRKQGPVHVPIVRELIKRDILVVVSDCTTPGLDDAGLLGQDGYAVAGQGLVEFCDYLEVDPVLNIGNCVERSRINEFCTTLAKQFGLEAGNLPFVTIANGQLHDEADSLDLLNFSSCLDAGPGNDSAAVAGLIDAHIHAKRLNLAWCDQCHCSIHS